MVKKLILHVGVGKTGSSSIQKYLERFTTEKNSLGSVFYPVDPDRSSLFSEYLSSCCYPIKKDKKLMEINDYLLSRVKSSSACIISGEILTHSNQCLKARVFDFLKSVFDEIQIIAYVRNPFKWNAATAGQLLLDGISLEHLEKWPYLETQYGLLKFYHEIALEYENVNLTVHKFEDSITLSGGVAENFCYLVNDYYKRTILDPPTERLHFNRSKTTLEYMILGYANSLLKNESRHHRKDMHDDIVRHLYLLIEMYAKCRKVDTGFTQLDFNNVTKVAVEYDRAMLYNHYGIHYDIVTPPEIEEKIRLYKDIRKELEKCNTLSRLKVTAELICRKLYT